MEKRPRKTPAERARAQYTNYAVREPMELMDFLAAKMPDASRTKLKSLLSKRGDVSYNEATDVLTFSPNGDYVRVTPKPDHPASGE